MLFSVEQAFAGREEIRAPLKTPAWEARANGTTGDADELGGYLESLLSRLAFCKSEIWVLAIEPWSLYR